ncbi:cytochrome P450 [Gloeophyllum trabeum ATCC 11539]|uniref:Cytochrome P450 n=1 Tax=Gloeophyllum trabeum (strain ATCC 11539 / FP-39264 / Madison 617) TaxID=670483 RepID=S7QBW6_GLOTA|nr:cytochrome P450 [Gloeophyllum trabeum ATCC 11539]EPQ56837.1 cytochrome P450 [Gloeophyllum trabeum ATCC 11539]
MVLHLVQDAFISGLGLSYTCHIRKVPGDVALILLCMEYGMCWFMLNDGLRGLEFVGVQLGTALLATAFYRLSPWHPLASFPGPVLHKLSGLKSAQLVYTGKRHLAIERLHNIYGVFVRTGPNTVSIRSLNAVNSIYTAADCMNKSDAYLLGRTKASGMFFIPDRDEHNLRRSRWAGAFTPSALNGYEPFIKRRVKQLVSCLEDRSDSEYNVNLVPCFQHFTYDLMGDIVFGGSNRIELMSDGDPHSYVQCGHFATMTFEILGEVPWLFNILYHLPITKDIHALKRFSDTLMRTRKMDTNGPHNDLSAHLLGEIDSEEKSATMSDEELVEDSVFAVQAGSDSTASVLTFLLYYMISSPTALKTLRAEIDSAFMRDPSQALNSSVLASLPYLNAVVKESLRLGTPFPGLPRVVPPRGMILEGKYIPGGTVVSVPAYAIQVSPEHFGPDPLSFRPERWLNTEHLVEGKADRSALMCFSFGPFSCMGRNLAIRELRMASAYLFLTFDIAFSDKFDSERWIQAISGVRSTIFGEPLLVKINKRSTG